MSKGRRISTLAAGALAKAAPAFVCLDCRTALRSGQACPGGAAHRVVAANDARGRNRLLALVWGPREARKRAMALVKVGGTGLGFGLILETCGGSLVSAVPVLAVFLIIPFFVYAVYWVLNFVWENIQAHRHRLKPRGASMSLTRGADTGLLGVVRRRADSTSEEAGILSAASETPCLGYAIELLAESFRSSEVMLRHSYATRFEIALDDGSVVEVPAGYLRLRGAWQEVKSQDAHVDAYLDLDIAPHADDLSPFPHQRVAELVLREGARVRILGELEREPLAETSGYRSAGWRHIPQGVVELEIEPDTEELRARI